MLSKSVSVVSLTAFLLFGFPLMGNAPEVDSKPLLHPLFADHAVIQRDSQEPVWGWAQPGATIIVSFAGQKKNTTAATDGTLDGIPRSNALHAKPAGH